MLQHLHIQNYALIGHLDIDFDKGFQVITGETGAGKSILLGALNLVMGGKADAKCITDGETHCIIEATFCQDDAEIIVRRELNANGRSRSFINDEVASQAELKQLSEKLVDIHSQHANLLIGDSHFQITVLDNVAKNETALGEYQVCYQAQLEAQKELEKALALAEKYQSDQDYITYQWEQLEEAKLVPGEWEQWEQEAYQLSHAEDIKRQLMAAQELLDGENGAIQCIKECKIDDAAQDLAERLHSTEVELKDIVREVGRLAERSEMNPERLQEVEERMDLLQTLMNKHHVQTVEELIDKRNELGAQRQRIESFDEEIAALKEQEQAILQQMQEKAAILSQGRLKVVSEIETRTQTMMKKLGVQHAHVKITVEDASQYTETGKDEVNILFAANLNQSLRPISEVASGGEIARMMLCIKALIAQTKNLPTILFDEIDTGVSGEVATQMGEIMRNMADNRQIIAITHLGQIAAKGDVQYRVYKEDSPSRTETHIERLTAPDRVEQIAIMLAGNNPSKEAIATAKQLLQK